MVKQIVLVFIFSLVYSTFGLDTNFSPVLFFKTKENKNVYSKSVISSTTPINQREFEQRISALDQNQKIVFLVTDDLSPEDLSIRNEHNRRGFENLATGVDIVEYIPYVENAADNKITMGKNVARATLISNNELEPKPRDGARIIIVSLPECGESESRYHCMAHIDRACYALSTSDEFKDALFVLTSEMNSQLHEVHSRRAREAPKPEPVPDNSGRTYKSPNFLVYFKDLIEHPIKAKDAVDTVIPVTGVTSKKLDEFNVELEFSSSKYNILLHFTLHDGSWTPIKSLSTLNGKQIDLQSNFSVPSNYSFACNSSLYFNLNTDEKPKVLDGIFFKNLQLQLNFTNNASDATIERFYEPYDCIGFTSPGIWAGLFITFLLLSIISIAITYIMDIRSMDRFDDPKGKTITISAAE